MPNRKKLQAALTVFICCVSSVPQYLAAECGPGARCAGTDCSLVERTYQHGRWFVLETRNFQICCEGSQTQGANLARHAEALRAALHVKWLNEAPSAPWSPRCQIVLYANQRNYVATVGRGSERTVGSSLVKVDQGQITGRRIDLVGGSTDYLSAALPHELTHVVLRDRFPTRAVPRWADEGMAILADSPAKQNRHATELRDAIANRTTYSAGELVTTDDYPAPSRLGAFYGQSASLTQFLVARKSPEQFVEFVDQASKHGYDAALKACYEIPTVAELDRQWRRQGDSIQLASHYEVVQSGTLPSHAVGRNRSLASDLQSTPSSSN